jgi:uncharacterized protein YraI
MVFHFRRASNDASGERRKGAQPGYADLIAQRELPLSERPAPVRRRAARGGKALIIGGAAVAAVLAIAGLVYATSGSKEAPARPAVLVSAHQLNCRASPSPASGVVGVAIRGETLVVVEQRGSWRRVELHGARCWVSGDFLQPAA